MMFRRAIPSWQNVSFSNAVLRALLLQVCEPAAECLRFQASACPDLPWLIMADYGRLAMADNGPSGYSDYSGYSGRKTAGACPQSFPPPSPPMHCLRNSQLVPTTEGWRVPCTTVVSRPGPAGLNSNKKISFDGTMPDIPWDGADS